MKFDLTPFRRQAAFTLLEVIMTSAFLGVILAGVFAGIGGGFSMISLARENLRGDQILLEKTETLRLLSWEQVNSNGFIPPTFSAPFYPPVVGQTNVSPGITYYGKLTITNAPFSVGYTPNLKLVTVSLTWTNGHVPRIRTMDTLVSEFGMQTYIY